MADFQSLISRSVTTTIDVRGDNLLRLVYPPEPTGVYANVFSRIIAKGLAPAQADVIAALLHLAYCELPEEPQSADFRAKMRDRWLWVPNRTLLVGGNDAGIYVQYDEQGVGLAQKMDIVELERALESADVIEGVRFSRDGNVRFAPRHTFRLGECSCREFARDGFVIASYGPEGAEKLAQVAATLKLKPRILLEDAPDGASQQRLSALTCCYGESGLVACGESFGDYGVGFGFGVGLGD